MDLIGIVSVFIRPSKRTNKGSFTREKQMNKQEAWEDALALIAEDLQDFMEDRFDDLIFEDDEDEDAIRQAAQEIVNGIYNRAYREDVTKITL